VEAADDASGLCLRREITEERTRCAGAQRAVDKLTSGNGTTRYSRLPYWIHRNLTTTGCPHSFPTLGTKRPTSYTSPQCASESPSIDDAAPPNAAGIDGANPLVCRHCEDLFQDCRCTIARGAGHHRDRVESRRAGSNCARARARPWRTATTTAPAGRASLRQARHLGRYGELRASRRPKSLHCAESLQARSACRVPDDGSRRRDG